MYQPKIRDDQVRTLFKLKLQTGKKMTSLIREAVDRYIDIAMFSKEKEGKSNG